MADLKNTNIDDNLELPSGTTGERPSSPQEGQIRYNTDLETVEFYNGSNWRPLSDTHPEAEGGTVVDTDIGGVPYRIHYFTETGTDTLTVTNPGEVEYLIVAGGGGGPGRYGGGGGAGGVLQGTEYLELNSYSITVGVGGSGGAQTPGECCNSTRSGNRGNNSSAFGFTATGGGGGISNNAVAKGNHNGEQDGGSGSGAVNQLGPGTGTSGQGNDGGTSNAPDGDYNHGGGGGAGSPGENSTIINSGNGGDGIVSRITGETKFYGGGGAGGSHVPHPNRFGKGGLGGGADARLGGGPLYTGLNGQANTGGGGGSAVRTTSTNTGPGGNGGSGIVIVRYPKNSSQSTSADRIIGPSIANTNEIITNNLVLHLDAADPKSYSNKDDIWRDSQNGIELTGQPSASLANSKSLLFDSGPRYLVQNSDLGPYENFTCEVLTRIFSSSDGYNAWFSASQDGGTDFNTGINWDLGSSGNNDLYDTQNIEISRDFGGFYNRDIMSSSFGFGTWVYQTVTVSATDGRVRMYINGVQEYEKIDYAGTITYFYNIAVGARFYGSTNSFAHPPLDGEIAYLRLYSKELSAEEVEQNYNASKLKYGF